MSLAAAAENENQSSTMDPALEHLLYDVDSSLNIKDGGHSERTSIRTPGVLTSKAFQLGQKSSRLEVIPQALQEATRRLISEAPERNAIRNAALSLFEHLRTTAKIPETKEKQSPKFQRKNQVNISEAAEETVSVTPSKRPEQDFDAIQSLAYVAGLMPTSYAVIYSVLKELTRRVPDLKPTSMLDFGTGPGTALWAARNVDSLKESLAQYLGVDASRSMLAVASSLVTVANDQNPDWKPQFQAFLPQDYNLEADLVVSAFTLSEIASERERLAVLKSLWKGTKDVLILIDRGTPAGFRELAKAREFLLNEDKDGIHIVAPCPHDGKCPLYGSHDWCHFTQTVQRPDYVRHTKHSTKNEEDAKYSYVILRRGPRPSSMQINTATEPDDIKLSQAAYSWSRIVYPPLKRPRHITLDVCAGSGSLERFTVAKSKGKTEYTDARKSRWGDLYPHPPPGKVEKRTGLVKNTRSHNV